MDPADFFDDDLRALVHGNDDPEQIAASWRRLLAGEDPTGGSELSDGDDAALAAAAGEAGDLDTEALPEDSFVANPLLDLDPGLPEPGDPTVYSQVTVPLGEFSEVPAGAATPIFDNGAAFALYRQPIEYATVGTTVSGELLAEWGVGNGNVDSDRIFAELQAWAQEIRDAS